MSYQSIIRDSDIIDGFSVRYLKFFGLWKAINDCRITGKRNAIMKLQLIIMMFLAVPCVVLQMISYTVIDIDIQKVTILNLNAIPAMQMCCRILMFWFCVRSQCKLYSLSRKDFLDVSKNNLPEVSDTFKKISKTSNLLCTMSLIANVSIIAIYILFPGVSVDYVLHHTGNMADVKTGRKKILGGWYPVPMDESPYYEIIFVYETLSLLWGALYLQVYFCLFYQVLMCLYAQFAVLGVHISSLKFDKQRKIKKTDPKMYSELYEIIKDHQKLLRYTEELRSVYNPLVTLTLGMGILVLIIGAFQFLFGKTGDPLYIFRYLLLLAYQGIEVSLLCYGSSMIETAFLFRRQSSNLQFAIYSSDWYKADTKFRKTAQLVMVRSLRGVTLTAIRMYPVNVETLMAILQFTYSVTTLMSRMAE